MPPDDSFMEDQLDDFEQSWGTRLDDLAHEINALGAEVKSVQRTVQACEEGLEAVRKQDEDTHVRLEHMEGAITELKKAGYQLAQCKCAFALPPLKSVS